MHRYYLVWLVFLTVGIVLVGEWLLRPGTSYPGAHFNQAQNAAWLSVSWVNNPHSGQEIRALADNLARRQIRDIYVYTSYRKPNGWFNLTYAYSSTFVAIVKAAHPDMSVQAWVGLPVREFGLTSNWSVDLQDAATRQTIASFCAQVIQVGGFDGVHLDPEPVGDGDTGLLALLEDVRAFIGPNKTLSIATRRIAPVLAEARLPLVGRVVWSAGYYRQVARRVDQIALMTYDSGLSAAPLYRLWGRLETVAITRALDGEQVELFIGIPTSEEETATHRPRAENMASGLQGLVDGLNDTRARPRMVTGVAIYPHWETDEAEWTTYEALWLGMQ